MAINDDYFLATHTTLALEHVNNTTPLALVEFWTNIIIMCLWVCTFILRLRPLPNQLDDCGVERVAHKTRYN